MKRFVLFAVLAVVLAGTGWGAEENPSNEPIFMKSLRDTAFDGVWVATAGQCTSKWYNVRGQAYAIIWDAAHDSSTAGTTDSSDFTWVAQGNYQGTGSPYFPDSTGNGAGVATATNERVGHMFNTAIPEADTCYCQYPAFSIKGMEWVRFIGKSTTATNPQASKRWVRLRFQSEWKGGK